MKWRNITISGRAANGATTLSKALATTFKWKLINGGEMYRAYVREKGIPLENTTSSPDSYHRHLDSFMREKLKKETRLIVESWLAGFDAQGIPEIFKILVTCSNEGVRIDRLVNRDHMTVSEAKQHLKKREEENLKKWERLYHTQDFWNPKLYDLTIDTYTHGPEETLELALGAIGYPS